MNNKTKNKRDNSNDIIISVNSQFSHGTATISFNSFKFNGGYLSASKALFNVQSLSEADAELILFSIQSAIKHYKNFDRIILYCDNFDLVQKIRTKEKIVYSDKVNYILDSIIRETKGITFLIYDIDLNIESTATNLYLKSEKDSLNFINTILKNKNKNLTINN